MEKLHSNMDDSYLVARFQAGDNTAFGVLVEKHSASLSASIFQIIKDPMLVEDIMQETFIKAMNSIQSEKFLYSNFPAWIKRIARNLSIDYFRRVKRNDVISLDQEQERGHYSILNDQLEQSHEEDIINLEIDYDINELLNSLPPEQKEVLTLRFFHGLSFKEITEYMGDISINTCLGRARYALINLKRQIQETRSDGKEVLRHEAIKATS